MKTRKIVAGSMLATSLALGAVAVSAEGASAHTATDVPLCDSLSINASNYNGASISVKIDGKSVLNTRFTHSLSQKFTTDGKGYTYSVHIVADDGPKYNFDDSNSVKACKDQPCPTVTVTKVVQVPGPTVTKTHTETVTAPPVTVTAPPVTETVTAPPVTVTETAPPVTSTVTETAPPVTTTATVTAPPVLTTETNTATATVTLPQATKTKTVVRTDTVIKTVDNLGNVTKTQRVKGPTGDLAYTGSNVRDMLELTAVLLFVGGLALGYGKGLRIVRKH